MLKARVYVNLSEILGSLKRGQMKKSRLENHQTVDCPQKDTPGWWATVCCTSTKFKLQNLTLKQPQIFQISHFHKFY